MPQFKSIGSDYMDMPQVKSVLNTHSSVSLDPDYGALPALGVQTKKIETKMNDDLNKDGYGTIQKNLKIESISRNQAKKSQTKESMVGDYMTMPKMGTPIDILKGVTH